MGDMTLVNKKLMLAGLFLSKFGDDGLRALGFTTWGEAYNSLALMIGGRPTSLKMYRQEFDPFFPNGRKGWHKRGLRPTRKDFIEEFGLLTFPDFVQLVKTQFVNDVDVDVSIGKAAVAAGIADEETAFAKRMITGHAAENFFEVHYREVPDFSDCALTRTTSLGCGFDFKLSPPHRDFIAVEVKGLRTKSGQIQLTEKEFKMAEYLNNRFFLYVVTNFARTPRPCVIRDPVHSGITFEMKDVKSRSKVWFAQIAA